MREIKFRAFVKGKMVPASFLNNYRYCGRVDTLDFENMTAIVNLLQDVPLMQFTGLHDKNGKEIWEGDILKGSWRAKTNEVRFENGSFCIGYHLTVDDMEARESEVIGDIYSNPELLKKAGENG